MDNSLFLQHANNQKNDFASWISHCFGDELLASRISKMQDKAQIAEEIESRIEHARIKEKIMPKEPAQPAQPENPVQEPQQIDLDLDLGLQKPDDAQITLPSQQQIDLTLDSSLDVSIETQNDLPDLTPKPDAATSLDTSLEPSLSGAADLQPTSPALSLPEMQKADVNVQRIPEKITDKLPEVLAPRKEIVLENLPDVTKGIDELKTISSQPLPSPKMQPAIEPKQMLMQEESKKTAATVQIEKKDEQKEQEKLIQQLQVQQQVIEPRPQEKPADIIPAKTGSASLSLAAAQVTQSNPKVSAPTQPDEIASLTEDEKRILATDNKELSPKELFRKIKLQKTLKNAWPKEKQESPGQETEAKQPKELSKEDVQKQKLADDNPIDLLGISDEEFNKIIGVDPSAEFVATVSTDNIIRIKKRKHLKTGVPGFDELIDKGILEGSSVLVSGGPGSGKTTFCIQQLGWAAEHGEKCLFISLEEKEERLIEHMKGYGLNPEKYLKEENLKIKKLDSFKLSRAVEALLAHARGELMIDIAPVLDIIPEGFKPNRVVLDSLSSIAAAFAGRPEEYRIYVEQLFNIFEMTGATSFIITEIQGSEATGHGGIEDFLADGVINFYNMKKGTVRQPAIEVLKMRGVNHKKKIVPFGFISGKGLEIYPLEEVFHGD